MHDLISGSHIIIRPEEVKKTTSISKYVEYEISVMPMGLVSAPATLVTMMNEVFHGYIDTFCVVYTDEILIYSQTRQ